MMARTVYAVLVIGVEKGADWRYFSIEKFTLFRGRIDVGQTTSNSSFLQY